MKIDLYTINQAFQDLSKNPDKVLFLDANIFIPPDRSNLSNIIKAIGFGFYVENWLKPLFDEFSGLSIHESVYDELVEGAVHSFADERIKDSPSRLSVYYDKDLGQNEKALMNTYLAKISVHSQYDPQMDNKKDRGEIRTLSYMAVKNYTYFSAKDGLPIRLIKDAKKLLTGLDNLEIVHVYELIYYLYKTGKYDNKALRGLYKYHYYLTENEKKSNPDWGTFIQKMDLLYDNDVNEGEGK